MKKKSKSIDTKKLEHGHIYSHSMKKIEHVKRQKMKIDRIFPKKSVDWSMSIT